MRRLRRWKWWLLLILLLAAGWVAWQWLQPHSYIVFLDGHRELHRIRPNGNGAQRLTTLPEYSSLPAISPNGKSIAFSEKGELGVVEIDGDHRQQITHEGTDNFSPSFFPDNRTLVYCFRQEHAVTGQQESYLCRINLDGTGERQLTSGSYFDGGPKVSPDGRFIVFHSNRNGNWDLYRINSDGSGLTRLTTNPTRDSSPAISPDGRWIAFASDRGGTRDIYLMDAHGKQARLLVREDGGAYHLIFNPDGTRIAYTVTGGDPPYDYGDLCVINVNGRGRKQLTNNRFYSMLDQHLGGMISRFIPTDYAFPLWWGTEGEEIANSE